MTRSNATILAFVAAPAITALPWSMLAPLSGTRDLISIAGTFVVVYIFAGIATLVAGVPAYLGFRALGMVAWWSAVIVGLSVGMGAAWLIGLQYRSVGENLLFGLFGAASGVGFWLVWNLGKQTKLQTQPDEPTP